MIGFIYKKKVKNFGSSHYQIRKLVIEDGWYIQRILIKFITFVANYLVQNLVRANLAIKELNIEKILVLN